MPPQQFQRLLDFGGDGGDLGAHGPGVLVTAGFRKAMYAFTTMTQGERLRGCNSGYRPGLSLLQSFNPYDWPGYHNCQ
jgi:hypothetical protein